MSRTLTLICSGMAVPLAQAMAPHAQPDGQARVLGLLAGRGQLSERSVDRHLPWAQAAVLDTLQLSDQAASHGGAVMLRAAAAMPSAGFWMRLEPVHLVAGLDRISVTVLPSNARMSDAERDELQPLIQDYLAELKLTLHPAEQGQWLVSSERALDVQSVTPEYAAAHPNEQVLPTGADAGALRRLMTELQMLLHEHPVNQHRQRRGLPSINALWLHGEGQFDTIVQRALMPAFGDDAFLQGLYRLHGSQVQPLPDAATLLAQVQGDTLAVVDVSHWQALEQDWLVPLSAALRRGRITALHLVLERWQVQVSRPALFRLWRRPRPPAHWISRTP